jgi:excisionase family DNA binding protein
MAMRLLTVAEAARAAGVSEATLRNWTRRGRLVPALRVGRQGERLFREEDVQRAARQLVERQQRARAG